MESIAQSATTIVGDVLLFLAFMAALLVGLLIAAARMPADNPLRRILHAVSIRLGALLGLGVVAIPVETIPGIDIAFDFGAFALMIYFCVTLIRDVIAITKESRASAAAPPRIEIQARSVAEEPAFARRDLQLAERKDKTASRLPH